MAKSRKDFFLISLGGTAIIVGIMAIVTSIPLQWVFAGMLLLMAGESIYILLRVFKDW